MTIREFGYAYKSRSELQGALERVRALQLEWSSPPRVVNNSDAGMCGWVGAGSFSREQVELLEAAVREHHVQPADLVEIPRMCFDNQGQVACFLCDGELWPALLVPATRDAEAVLAVWAAHAAQVGGRHRPERPVLATLTSPIHAWGWPET